MLLVFSLLPLSDLLRCLPYLAYLLGLASLPPVLLASMLLLKFLLLLVSFLSRTSLPLPAFMLLFASLLLLVSWLSVWVAIFLHHGDSVYLKQRCNDLLLCRKKVTPAKLEKSSTYVDYASPFVHFSGSGG
jgi:hypothetical protein